MLVDSKLPKVAVLLAVYNGAKWLPDQLATLVGQRDVDISIYISVDLSDDCTFDLVTSYATSHRNVIVLPLAGRFGGAARNFYRLIRDVDFSRYDYLALSDQDDLWLDDKMSTAVARLSKGYFSVYSCNVTAFWPNGKELIVNKAQAQRRFDYLFEAAGPGCTYVMNRSAALAFKAFLIQNWPEVNQVSLHDWLIYAWCRRSGYRWFIDPLSKMRYRQHCQNQVGANNGLLAFKKRITLVRSGWYRSQVGLIARLLMVDDIPKPIVEGKTIPLVFLLTHAGQLRRRLRDRLALFFLVILGLY